MSGAALQSFETSFHQDLNGDGAIGVGGTGTGTVIELVGSTSLVAVGSKFFLDSISTGSGPLAEIWRRGRCGRPVWWLDADRRRADGKWLSGGLETPGRRSICRSGTPIATATTHHSTAFMSGAGAAIIRDQFPSGLERRRSNRCWRHRHRHRVGRLDQPSRGGEQVFSR